MRKDARDAVVPASESARNELGGFIIFSFQILSDNPNNPYPDKEQMTRFSKQVLNVITR